MMGSAFFGEYEKYRRVLVAAREKTEFSHTDYLYFLVMDKIIGRRDGFKFPLGVDRFPNMRLCVMKRTLETDFPYATTEGQVVFSIEVFNVPLVVSFDLCEFVKAFLLSDNEMRTYHVRFAITTYMYCLMDDLKARYPRMNLRKSDFTIYISDDVRVRVAQIMSFYMQKLTRKMVLARKPDKVIKNFYEKIYEK